MEYIGLGIYMIDNEGNDTKICKGFKTNNGRLKTSSNAELYNLLIFQDYIANNLEYIGKNFIVYADSEDVVRILNDKNCEKSFGFKKNIRQDIANIKGAYWVKGHTKEKGNNFVDVMAYNAMKKALENKKEFESISHNKTLADIFNNDVQRVKTKYWETALPEEINVELYNRALEEEKNVVNKIDSFYYKEKINLIINEDHYLAEIGMDNETYILNNKKYNDISFKSLIYIVFLSKTILKEIQKELNERVKIFEETSDIHFSALRLSKNSQFVIKKCTKP